MGVTPEKAIKVCIHNFQLAVNDTMREFFTNREKTTPEKLPLSWSALSGALAGTCAVIITNPMEMVKIQMQLNSNVGALETVRKLGLSGLYRFTVNKI